LRGGFNDDSDFRKKGTIFNDCYNRLMKNINLNIDDIINSNFILAEHNIFIITKSDLHDLFETLTNAPIKKKDSCFYERLFGMYFIKKKIKTTNITNNIYKVRKSERKF
jgi:hypothetical protein